MKIFKKTYLVLQVNNGELVPSHFVNYFFFIEIILYLVGV